MWQTAIGAANNFCHQHGGYWSLIETALSFDTSHDGLPCLIGAPKAGRGHAAHGSLVRGDTAAKSQLESMVMVVTSASRVQQSHTDVNAYRLPTTAAVHSLEYQNAISDRICPTIAQAIETRAETPVRRELAASHGFMATAISSLSRCWPVSSKTGLDIRRCLSVGSEDIYP